MVCYRNKYPTSRASKLWLNSLIFYFKKPTKQLWQNFYSALSTKQRKIWFWQWTEMYKYCFRFVVHSLYVKHLWIACSQKDVGALIPSRISKICGFVCLGIYWSYITTSSKLQWTWKVNHALCSALDNLVDLDFFYASAPSSARACSLALGPPGSIWPYHSRHPKAASKLPVGNCLNLTHCIADGTGQLACTKGVARAILMV